MDESTWLSCTDPQVMLEFLRGNASDRKLRLFAVACSWRSGLVSKHEKETECLRVSEEWVDGNVSDDQLRDSYEQGGMKHSSHNLLINAPEKIAYWAAATDAKVAAHLTVVTPEIQQRLDESGAMFSWDFDIPVCRAAAEKEQHMQADSLREIFGSLPFRVVTANPTWLTSTVVTLAQSIYDNRRFEDMPILADALEDAGCGNAEMLEHARSGGEHVRGCWLVDLLLQKE